ncbi:MAG: FixH family protein, partial [Roseomonas sp.]|nr:FixH family protein [Roseomonas sp.]
MSDNALSTSRDFDPNRSRWIPWAFVGGMTVVVLVNLVLVYAALSTFTGVTTGRSYDRGRAYNLVLEEAAR